MVSPTITIRHSDSDILWGISMWNTSEYILKVQVVKNGFEFSSKGVYIFMQVCRSFLSPKWKCLSQFKMSFHRSTGNFTTFILPHNKIIFEKAISEKVTHRKWKNRNGSLIKYQWTRNLKIRAKRSSEEISNLFFVCPDIKPPLFQSIYIAINYLSEHLFLIKFFDLMEIDFKHTINGTKWAFAM